MKSVSYPPIRAGADDVRGFCVEAEDTVTHGRVSADLKSLMRDAAAAGVRRRDHPTTTATHRAPRLWRWRACQPAVAALNLYFIAQRAFQ